MTDPMIATSEPPPPPRPGLGRAAAIALAVAATLLAVFVAGVAVARRGDDSSAPPPTLSASPTAVASTSSSAPSTTSAPTTSTTAPPAPPTVAAASDQKVLLLDSASGATVRVLFDLGPSSPTDREPPSIGSVALSSDGQTAFFDLVGSPPEGSMKRVATRGGQAEELGPGRAPTPSPDGATLAFLRPSEPGRDVIVLRGDGPERVVPLGAQACGKVAWAPRSDRLAVDLCSDGEPTTVAEVDATAARATTLKPPGGVRWIAPAYRGDDVLTLAEDRSGDSVVVTVVAGRVTGTVLRRDRTTVVCIDWDRARSLLFCEADGSVWVDPDEGDAHVVGTGYHTAVW